jgi:hypothetical protein
MAQRFGAANDGEWVAVCCSQWGGWQWVRNIVFKTEPEDSYQGCEVTEHFSQYIGTVMLGLHWWRAVNYAMSSAWS